ncbi:hypothetical protein BT69DRAFT_1347593 [Atractiella rhizophila]|nr:hypothetical protein BT69DRAFT_1347593 [Atractiella rhizophila]
MPRTGSPTRSPSPTHSTSSSLYGQPNSAAPSGGETSWGHYLPLLIAFIPPLGSLLGGGRSDSWSDALVLVLVGFWMVQIVKVPWEIHVSSIPPSVSHSDHATARLSDVHLLSLLATLVSPLLGTWLLARLLPSLLSDTSLVLSSRSLKLFCLAASIRPFSHFVSLLRGSTKQWQEEARLDPGSVEEIKGRVEKVERALRSSVIGRRDLEGLREGLEGVRGVVRRQEKSEQYLRLSAEDRFVLLEKRMMELEKEVESVHRAWYERGVMYFIFLPLNLGNALLHTVERKTVGDRKGKGKMLM